MKITIFGLTLSSSWGNGHATPYRALIRALHRTGHSVTFYERDVEYYRRHRDLPSCNYCKLVLYSSWEQVRASAIREAKQSDAVIVGSYCPGGARISDEVLGLAGPVRVFYDLDTPITLLKLDVADGLDYLRRDQMPHFDLYLSFTGGEILSELESDYGVRRARALYGCVDPDEYTRQPMNEEFRCDLSYMGTYAADRQTKLEALFLEPASLLPERTFVIAGSLYPWDWQWPQNVRKFDHVAPDLHPALYSSSRTTLNITRGGMARYGYCPSGRFFEAAACSTPILSDWVDGLETFFTPGEELIIVEGSRDVVDAVSAPEEELAAIARRGRERTLAEHTGENRARDLVRYLEEARSGTSRSKQLGVAR